MDSSLTALVREPAGDPAGALVLFHGRGADEHDLFPLLDLLDPDRRLLGVTPRGPLSLPPGGAHWYAIRELGYPDPATFVPTYERAAAWLDALATDTGISAERIVLGGFSQGAVMTYALGLGRRRRLAAPTSAVAVHPRRRLKRPVDAHEAHAAAGDRPLPPALIALSGFVPTVEGFELDLDRPLPPVAIGHGIHDPVIPVEWGRKARALLEAAGATVLYRESPLPHAVDPRFLVELAPWLAEALGVPARP